MTVGELRALLKDLPAKMTVVMEIDRSSVEDADDDLVQCDLESADVEARCDEVDRLYLWGSIEDAEGSEEGSLTVIQGGKED